MSDETEETLADGAGKVWRRADWQERFDDEAPPASPEDLTRITRKGPPIRLAAADDPDELHHEALEWFDPRTGYGRYVRAYFLQYITPLNPLVATYYSRYMDLVDDVPEDAADTDEDEATVPEDELAALAADYGWSAGWAREIRAACLRIMRAGFEGRAYLPADVRLIKGAGARSVPVSPPADVPPVDE